MFSLLPALLCALPVPACAGTGVSVTAAVSHPFELPDDASGHFDLSHMAVFADSEDAPGEDDNQVDAYLKPDMVLGSWFADRGDDTPLDQYNQDFRAACQDQHIVFMAGLNASAIYPGQAENLRQFKDWATQDADGEPVTHPEYKQPQYLASLRTAPPGRGDIGAARLTPPVMQRGSLANPRFRARLMGILEGQIDQGADGVVLGESDALGYRGNKAQGFNGDEGYDPYFLADFNRYLIDKYPGYIEANWEIQFFMSPDNSIAPWLPWTDAAHNFDYQRYLKAKGWTADPRNRAGLPDRPLADEWGDLPYPASDDPQAYQGFLAKDLAYLQKLMVLKIRRYARTVRQREIVVAAKGMLPDVDLNFYPLRRDNRDDGGKAADYLPLSWNGDLDGSTALLGVFKGLKARSRRISGRALLVLSLALGERDYASGYNDLSEDEKEDYWRIYVPEAYACGAFFAFHLKESLGQQPSAIQAGTMDFLDAYARFYKRNRTLFTDAEDGGRGVVCDAGRVACNVTEQDYWQRSLVHLINHNYNYGMLTQTAFTVSVASDVAPAVAYMRSPDFAGSTPVAFSFQGGRVRLQIPTLAYYDVVVLKWPVAGPRPRGQQASLATPTALPTFVAPPTPTPRPTRRIWPTRTPTPSAPLPALPPLPSAAWPLRPALAPPLPPSAGPAAPAPPELRQPPPPNLAALAQASPTPTQVPVVQAQATATPCVPGVMTLKRRVWVRSVLGDSRSLGAKAVLRLGNGPGDLAKFSLPFTLTAPARVWVEAEIRSGLRPGRTDLAPEAFLDDSYLGPMPVSQWRSPRALLLGRGPHHLTVRVGGSGDLPTVTVGSLRVLSDELGHWRQVTMKKPCGCGGPPCPKGD